jgi:hypothetical protein
MDADLHRSNLARVSSPTIVKVYETLVDELGNGFMTCRPHGHGYMKTLRFSRGSWNPLDFSINAADLLCYFRAPLFTAHPFLWDIVKRRFPEGSAKGKEWAFRVADRETASKLIQFVNGELRNSIENRPVR